MKINEGRTIPIPLSHDESIPSAITSKLEDSKQINGGGSPPSFNDPNTLKSNVIKAKSCKGCLYYSSRFKADSKNPICVGLTRSLPKAPQYTAGELEMEAYKAGRSLQDFRYGCVGYSVYVDRKEQGHIEQKKLPWCLGLEVIEDRRVNNEDSRSAPLAHIHNREEGNGLPKHGSIKPTNSTGDDYLSRFSRSANLVANGVTKNIRRVGNQIKRSLDEVLYPYRRRPK
ncbi:hypothetical protein PHJA_002196900 [Phtheirospermum japonicum]|uniref:DUF8204 domain-containing protein n=1 Tax=Phtheirospermum japonicum TaxID=374723 RepID=A0A830CNF7_9LAMI|nr:hypothetical protein PHJA_002196900 [Phtheirospermum japonicum]